MAYPEHYLAVMGGTLRGDIWCCNIRMIAGAVMESGQQEEKAQSVFNAWKNTCADPAVNIVSSAVVLTYGKFNRINPDGTYHDPNTTHEYFGAPVAPASAPTHANQDALVLSWVTDAQRGPGSKGRIYVPCPSIAIVALSGKIAASNAVIAANFGAALINRLNDDPNWPAHPDLECAVVSKVGGVAFPIRSVRVGDVLDTQRRRRNAMVETYSVNSQPIL